MAIHHIAFGVGDLEASRAFYAAALAPLGFAAPRQISGGTGYAFAGEPTFMISSSRPVAAPFHLAFAATDRAAVDTFHAAAVAAGGIDNGGPGVRENYGPDYYAAFVHDPDGNNIEAVINQPV